MSVRNLDDVFLSDAEIARIREFEDGPEVISDVEQITRLQWEDPLLHAELKAFLPKSEAMDPVSDR